jgi:purine-binding chemotaxis protein CheW
MIMLSSPDSLNSLTDDRSETSIGFQSLESPEGDLHLKFYTSSGTELALPAVDVREVVAPAPNRITPVPNSSPLLLGILNLRGQVIWVADIGQFLGDSPALNTDRSEISVIAIEQDEVVVGLAVDQIIGMDWLNPEKLRLSSDAPDSMAPYLLGEWLIDSETNRCLRLLDPIAILRSARWAG